MPINLKREQKSHNMITLQRGSKRDLGKVLDPRETIYIKVGVLEKDIDFACFGFDVDNRVNEQFFIFYNQISSPEDEISLEDPNINPALFQLELSRFPKTIKRLVFTASTQNSRSTFDKSDIDVEIKQNSAGFHLRLLGSDFATYKSIILIELSLDSVWQLETVADGFNGNLDGLVDHYGVKVDDGVSQDSVSTEPVVQRDGKIWIHGEEFTLDPENDWV